MFKAVEVGYSKTYGGGEGDNVKYSLTRMMRCQGVKSIKYRFLICIPLFVVMWNALEKVNLKDFIKNEAALSSHVEYVVLKSRQDK